MDNESIQIFDERRNELGVATRKEIHKVGYWHETFHCWLISQEGGSTYIYFQIRSESKKDFPGLLDITAAGHILAHEKVSDGIREVKEELGIDLSYRDLIPLGVIPNSIIREGFIDNEFSHVFLYKTEKSINDFDLQREEVSGIVKAEFRDFCKLWSDESVDVNVKGFKMNQDGHKVLLNRNVSRGDFVPHEKSYWEMVLKSMRTHLS